VVDRVKGLHNRLFGKSSDGEPAASLERGREIVRAAHDPATEPSRDPVEVARGQWEDRKVNDQWAENLELEERGLPARFAEEPLSRDQRNSGRDDLDRV